MKTCDKCKNYLFSSMKDTDWKNCGNCSLMGDSNSAIQGEEVCKVDQCVGWDYEGYSAGVYVGPKFGCIHWVKK
jgi:hypothetical protein